MILKMIQQTPLNSKSRKKFIPFVNQRNHMGQIIKTKQKDKSYIKSIQVFENLKKTTKQYFFDKKYMKMKNKLQSCKLNLQPKQHNYDQEIQKCFRTLQKSVSSNFGKSFNTYNTTYKSEQSTYEGEKGFFYIDLSQKLNKNIEFLQKQIQCNRLNKKMRMEKTMNQFMKHKSVHSQQKQNFRHKTQINQISYCNISEIRQKNKDKQNVQDQWKDLKTFERQQACMSQTVGTNQTVGMGLSSKNLRKKIMLGKMYESSGRKKERECIKREIFKGISGQSENMANFTNEGLKYKHLIEQSRRDPWKRWYEDQKLQIFPGQVVVIKKLQKSIYDYR